MFKIVLPMVLSFILCAIAAPILIPFLRKLKFGQQILEIGPKWHQSKSGTPTMGGIAFILSTLLTLIVIKVDLRAYIVFGFALLCGAIGFVDDYIKVCKKRNLGFNVIQKTISLIAVIITFVFISYYFGFIDNKVFIPFIDKYVDFSYFYFPFIIFVIFGTINSVNLTDGIDGLAGSVTAIIMIYYTITAYILNYLGLSVLTSAMLGGLIGFLMFNLYPAKMFMGDTGSLFLGGLVCAVAVMMKNPLILIIVGFVYVLEALSDIIQVVSFKMTGKRVFKMAPLHHHLEMSGFSENKIVITFGILTVLLCIIGFIGTIKF